MEWSDKRRSCDKLLRGEAVVDDAHVLVLRAADEAEAVGQQRQREHAVCVVGPYVVLEGAQDGAVVDVEELDASSEPARRKGVRLSANTMLSSVRESASTVQRVR